MKAEERMDDSELKSLLCQTEDIRLYGILKPDNIYLKLLQLQNGSTTHAFETSISKDDLHESTQMNQCFDAIQEIYEHLKSINNFSVDLALRELTILWEISKGRSKYLKIGTLQLKQSEINICEKLQQIHTKCKNNVQLQLKEIVSMIGFLSKSMIEHFRKNQVYPQSEKKVNQPQVEQIQRQKIQKIEEEQRFQEIKEKLPSQIKLDNNFIQSDNNVEGREINKCCSNDQNRCQLQKIEQKMKINEDTISALSEKMAQLQREKYQNSKQYDQKITKMSELHQNQIHKLSQKLEGFELMVPMKIQQLKEISKYSIQMNQKQPIQRNQQKNIIFLPIEIKNWISQYYKNIKKFTLNVNKITVKHGGVGGFVFGSKQIKQFSTFAITVKKQYQHKNFMVGIASRSKQDSDEKIAKKICFNGVYRQDGNPIHDSISNKQWASRMRIGRYGTLIITVDLKAGRIRWRMSDSFIVTEHEALKDPTIDWYPYTELQGKTTVLVHQPNCTYELSDVGQ